MLELQRNREVYFWRKVTDTNELAAFLVEKLDRDNEKINVQLNGGLIVRDLLTKFVTLLLNVVRKPIRLFLVVAAHDHLKGAVYANIVVEL